MRVLKNLLLPVAAVLAALAGYWVATEVNHEQTAARPPAEVTLADLSGQSRALSEWNGKWVLVNFWATWCPPCRDEIPVLMKVRQEQRARNFEVIGIAVDQAEAVQIYSESVGIAYPILLAGDDAFALMSRFGNPAGALPYTVLLSPEGKIVTQHRGALSEMQLAQLITRHLPAK